MVSSLKALMLNMLKCRKKRDVTAFLPPPGGPMAEMSCRSTRVILEVFFRSYLPETTRKKSVCISDNSFFLFLSGFDLSQTPNSDWFIPVPMVNVLSKKLYWRLCSKLLQCRHVHVIHKDDTLLPHGRPKHSFPSLI